MSRSQPWTPCADVPTLRRRAQLLSQIRAWLCARDALEVETPLIGLTTTTDPNVHSVRVPSLGAIGGGETGAFLQTSPEHHMKRLLAAGSGPVFQLCKAFRGGEQGRLHNPEFTMLEWYEPGLDHHGLMTAVERMLIDVIACTPGRRVSYKALFEEYAHLDPMQATDQQLQDCVRSLGADAKLERTACLDLILGATIQPKLTGLLFVYDFPAEQAALARVRADEPRVAERFELFIEGIEVANGYHELTDAAEQRRRFVADNARRRALGLPRIPVDEHLLGALEAGLPECAGVAIGIDRLLMLALGQRDISSVLTFPFSRA